MKKLTMLLAFTLVMILGTAKNSSALGYIHIHVDGCFEGDASSWCCDPACTCQCVDIFIWFDVIYQHSDPNQVYDNIIQSDVSSQNLDVYLYDNPKDNTYYDEKFYYALGVNQNTPSGPKYTAIAGN